VPLGTGAAPLGWTLTFLGVGAFVSVVKLLGACEGAGVLTVVPLGETVVVSGCAPASLNTGEGVFTVVPLGAIVTPSGCLLSFLVVDAGVLMSVPFGADVSTVGAFVKSFGTARPFWDDGIGVVTVVEPFGVGDTFPGSVLPLLEVPFGAGVGSPTLEVESLSFGALLALEVGRTSGAVGAATGAVTGGGDFFTVGTSGSVTVVGVATGAGTDTVGAGALGGATGAGTGTVGATTGMGGPAMGAVGKLSVSTHSTPSKQYDPGQTQMVISAVSPGPHPHTPIRQVFGKFLAPMQHSAVSTVPPELIQLFTNSSSGGVGAATGAVTGAVTGAITGSVTGAVTGAVTGGDTGSDEGGGTTTGGVTGADGLAGAVGVDGCSGMVGEDGMSILIDEVSNSRLRKSNSSTIFLCSSGSSSRKIPRDRRIRNVDWCCFFAWRR
jgi:hypothetical protein